MYRNRLACALLITWAFVSVAHADGIIPEHQGRGTAKAATAINAAKGTDTDRFNHVLWGQSSTGEGYIYGPTNRRSGMTVVDIDLDGDNDFVFPNELGNPQLMRNLGSSTAFYPGGAVDMDFRGLPSDLTLDLGLDFADLTGDGLPEVVAEVFTEGLFVKKLVWYRNAGPLDNPRFDYQGELHTSLGNRALWPAFSDIDADGDKDLFVADAVLFASERQHRVFFLQNNGASSAPAFAAAIEIEELGELLPDAISSKELRKSVPPVRAHNEILRAEDPAQKDKQTLSYNLGDIVLADWDADGVTDFLFYDRSKGLMWVRNVGTAANAAWDNKLGSNGMPRYDHRIEDGTVFEEATFAIYENPEAAQPGAEWLRDVFISVNSTLKTFRFFLAENAYRIVQASPVAFPAGQGCSAFWDFDLDGDLDMFRLGISEQPQSDVLLFPNIGTPYNPVWGRFRNLSGAFGLRAAEGTAANNYRQDLFQMADHDGVLGPDMFVQRQDGSVELVFAYPNTPTDEIAGDGGIL